MAEKQAESQKKSSKKKDVKFRCKSCGNILNPSDNPPNKTWNMIAPIPDKNGRVTLTIMGSFTCPKCSKNMRVAMQKIKTDEEFSGKSKKEELMDTLRDLDKKTNITEIANNLGLSKGSIEKAISLLIRRGELKGSLEGDFFMPSSS